MQLPTRVVSDAVVERVTFFACAPLTLTALRLLTTPDSNNLGFRHNDATKSKHIKTIRNTPQFSREMDSIIVYNKFYTIIKDKKKI
jgi:hypothetical protein